MENKAFVRKLKKLEACTDASAAAARDETLSQCAEIFRKAFPDLFKEPE